MERDGILEHQRLENRGERVKIQTNSIYFLSPLEFSKFSLATEAKVQHYLMWFSMYIEKIFKMTINGESKKNIQGKGFYNHSGK